MTARDFLTNVTIILAIMALAALLETVVPMFSDTTWKRDRRTANLGLTALSFLFNWMLTSAVALVALTFSVRPAGLMTNLGLPLAAQIVAGVLVLDFSAGYLSHRALHMSPFLWRFHRIHHSDRFVDVTTTYRTHPIETFWRFLFVIIPVWTIGIPAPAVVMQRLVQATNGLFEHANIRLWAPLDRVLSVVWVTPNLHKIHHSRDRSETNSNYGNVLSIYDRMFGTFTPTDHAYSVVYGLDDAEDPVRSSSLPGLLAMPFLEAESVPREARASSSRHQAQLTADR